MTDLNEWYSIAKSNPVALSDLTLYLLNIGKKMAKGLLTTLGIFNVNVDDLEDFILFTINYIFNTYDGTKKSFEHYEKFVLHKRLTTKIIELCNTNDLKTASLDDCFEDGSPLYEVIPDNDLEPIPSQISNNEIKLRMSSPKNTRKPLDAKKRRVFILENAGYCRNEIMKLLNLSIAQYKYIKNQIKNDFDSVDFKIELK